MAIKIFQVDAFASKPFTGNPAAVCLLEEPKPDDWMQSVAAEMNLSETAFVVRSDAPEKNRFQLRWFTPKVQVDLCGHATLATAHVLWECGWLPENELAVFDSRSGELKGEKADDMIYLNFPATPAKPKPLPAELLAALKVDPIYSGTSREDWLIEVATANEVRNVDIDFHQLAKAKTRGVILTAASDKPEFDFVSRFFAPAVGIDEDPVTGSAHCCLAPFWSEKLGADNVGKTELSAFQASTRGGHLKLRVEGDRVHIGGQAITIKRGELLV